MVSFVPSDPFPLINLERHTLAELKTHAAAVDAWLGLRTDLIERELASYGSRARAPRSCGEHQQLWFGLDVQALMTPYCEIRALLERLQPRAGECIVDMGAAYGRMAFVVERHFREVEFVGYEYVGERVHEARRTFSLHRLKRSRIEHVDLASPDFSLAEAQIYFIYDYGSPKAIEKSLHDLRRLAGRMAGSESGRDSGREFGGRPLTVVGRGRHCRYLIAQRHPWLRQAFPGDPEGLYTVYRGSAATPALAVAG